MSVRASGPRTTRTRLLLRRSQTKIIKNKTNCLERERGEKLTQTLMLISSVMMGLRKCQRKKLLRDILQWTVMIWQKLEPSLKRCSGRKTEEKFLTVLTIDTPILMTQQ